MNPAAMDFEMHRSTPTSNRGGLSPMSIDHQHSPCPALREQNQLPGLQSQMRSGGGGSHYDPVHGSLNTGNWWSAGSHDAWQHPQYNAPHILPRQMPMYTQAPPFSAPPGLIPPTHALHTNPLPMPFAMGNTASDYYGAQIHQHHHYHHHGHAHSPNRFSQQPAIPSIDRSGGAGPNHHSSTNFGNASNNHVTSEHGSHPGRLPTLVQVSANPLTTPPSRSIVSPARTEPSGRYTRTPERSSMAARSSSATVTMPNIIPRITDSSQESQQAAVGHGHHIPASNSDTASDEDSDLNDTELMTARMLDVITATGEPGLRAAQLLRGVNPGRKVASKKAIADLESVKISDLPESERACIICYNDFGTETPEGINEAPLRLPKCQHVFGDHCIKKWFAESDSCPYCRDKLPSEPQSRLGPESILQYMGRSQMQMQQALRHAGRAGLSRDNHGEAGWGNSEASGSTSYRRPDNTLPSFRTWQQSERRSPPGDLGDNRRRTRFRHGSLRGSPPSARTNLFLTPGISGPVHAQYHPHNGRYYPSGHNHRHSMGAVGPHVPAPVGFEQNMPPSLGQISMYQPHEPRLPYPNPLATNESVIQPRWPLARPDSDLPLWHRTGDPDVRMADAEERNVNPSA